MHIKESKFLSVTILRRGNTFRRLASEKMKPVFVLCMILLIGSVMFASGKLYEMEGRSLLIESHKMIQKPNALYISFYNNFDHIICEKKIMPELPFL